MKLKLLIASLLFCFIASAQINDPNVLRNYINANVIPNNTRNVTAQQLNNILNGQLNVMQLADIDSFATSPTFDTLFIYQHNAAGQKVRKGYHIGGNFDTSSLNTRINSLNTTKLSASDSLSKYVTPSQLQQVSGGNVYVPGDNIVKISGAAISVDTVTGVPTKNFVFANFPPKTRTINSKPLSANIQLNKSDFPDLNVVDNTSDMDKPLSNKQRDSLTRKVDKTITVNGKSLSGNIAITQDDIGLSNADNTHDADKPVSNATKDSLNASTLQKTLDRSSSLNKNNTLNAGEYEFNIAAKSVNLKGKGMTTKFGVIQNPNSNTNLLASLVGTGVVRSGYTFTAANATPTLTLLNNGYEVVVNLNAFAQDGSRGMLSTPELPQFKKTLDSLFTVYFTGRNAHIFFNLNEQFNTGYYILDSSSALKYAIMQNLFDSVVHAHGGLTADGGLTGNAMKWLPYKDLLDQGRTADANEYAQSEFTAAEISGGLNWDVTGPYKLQIYLTRQWLNSIKNNATDFINLHWKTPTNGINSDTINVRPFQWAVQYYSRASGKPVSSNEIGLKSTKPYIAKQLFKAATDMNFYLAIWYSGTGTTFNAEDINLLNGSSLSTVGTGVKGSYDTANASQRIALTVQDGKASFPSVGMGTKLPAYFDENNNLVPGPVTSGSNIDTAAINRAIGNKADSVDLTKKVDKVTGKGLSTKDYSTNDSNAVATIPLKEDAFVITAFTTSLPFDNNYFTQAVKIQTAPILFSLSGSNRKTLKRYVFSVQKNSDSIGIPNAKFLNDSRFQDGKLNYVTLSYLPGDSVLIEVNIPDADHTNMYTLNPGQNSFTTYPNYDLYKVEVINDIQIDFSLSTTVDGEDIFPLTKLQPGYHSFDIDFPTFTSAQTVRVNGVSSATITKIPKPF